MSTKNYLNRSETRYSPVSLVSDSVSGRAGFFHCPHRPDRFWGPTTLPCDVYWVKAAWAWIWSLTSI